MLRLSPKDKWYKWNVMLEVILYPEYHGEEKIMLYCLLVEVYTGTLNLFIL